MFLRNYKIKDINEPFQKKSFKNCGWVDQESMYDFKWFDGPQLPMDLNSQRCYNKLRRI